MKKFFRSLKTWVITVLAISCAIACLFAVRFLVDTTIYYSYTLKLTLIEQDANQGYWTANGLVRWSESQVKAYEDTLENKENFIENSDVATYLYYSGFSLTGKMVRLIAIFVIIFITYYSVKSISIILKIICIRVKKHMRNKKHVIV